MQILIAEAGVAATLLPIEDWIQQFQHISAQLREV